MILTEDRGYSLRIMVEDGAECGLDKKDCEMEFTGRELLHALFATELPIQRLTPRYEGKRQMEFLWKAALVETSLTAEGDRLKRSPALDELEGSERALLVYYIGLIFARLISKKLFDCDFLTHGTLIAAGEAKRSGGDSCPDRYSSVGYCRRTGGFSVWEALGKSENSPRALLEGCVRAGSIRSICKEPVCGAYVCMTYFENGYLTAVVREPSEKMRAEAQRELEFDKDAYFEACCRPMTEFLSDKSSRILLKERGGVRCLETAVFLPDFQEGAVPGIGRSITVGTEEELYRGLLAGRFEILQRRDRHGRISGAEEAGLYCGGDGFYIGT